MIPWGQEPDPPTPVWFVFLVVAATAVLVVLVAAGVIEL
jgi:hypothetical protein